MLYNYIVQKDKLVSTFLIRKKKQKKKQAHTLDLPQKEQIIEPHVYNICSNINSKFALMYEQNI